MLCAHVYLLSTTDNVAELVGLWLSVYRNSVVASWVHVMAPYVSRWKTSADGVRKCWTCDSHLLNKSASDHSSTMQVSCSRFACYIIIDR